MDTTAEIEFITGDLTLELTDAIVNPAGPGLVDLAIRRAAGPMLLEELHWKLFERGERKLRPGRAIVTHGFGLAAPHVIHCGPPVYFDGPEIARAELVSCHVEAVRLARAAGFASVSFPAIEIYAFHFATAPGTFGRDRAPAFADSYYMATNEPQVARAGGITLYTLRNGTWERRRVWRKANGKSLQYGLAMGDLDGDKLDDIVFPDSEERRLRIFFQQPDGTFLEAAEKDEPALDSPGQCVRIADIDRDGRPDLVLSKTVSAVRPEDVGGWDVYLNRR